MLAIHLQPNNRADEHATVDVLISVSFGISSLSLPLRVISQVKFLYILQRKKKDKNAIKR